MEKVEGVKVVWKVTYGEVKELIGEKDDMREGSKGIVTVDINKGLVRIAKERRKRIG